MDAGTALTPASRDGVYALVASAVDDAIVALPPFEAALDPGSLWFR